MIEARAKVISEALKDAFGGASQVPVAVIGQAVAGQINNNGLGVYGDVETICRSVLADFDGDSEYETPIDEVVSACRVALDRLGIRHAELPWAAAK